MELFCRTVKCLKLLFFKGKSGIHGFGIFAKHPYKGGDMVKRIFSILMFLLCMHFTLKGWTY